MFAWHEQRDGRANVSINYIFFARDDKKVSSFAILPVGAMNAERVDLSLSDKM